MKIKEAYQNIHLDEQTEDHILESILKSQEKDMQTKKNYKPLITFAVILCLVFIPITLPFEVIDSSNSYSEGNETIEAENTPASQLYQLPSHIKFEDMKKSDFYIQTLNQTYNQDIMNDFLRDVENKIPSKVIVVNFTIEGDPIFQEIQYSPDKTTIYFDASRDQYGVFPEIEKYEFKHLGVLENNLYAYNNTLNLDTILSDDTYHITYIVKQETFTK